MTPELRQAPGAPISESPSRPTAAGVDGLALHRIVSVDVLRGVTVMLMILANASAGFKDDAPRCLLHSHWQGLTLADLIFPAFITLVGVSIPLALHRSRRTDGIDFRQAFHILWRTLRIVLLGVLLTNLDWFSNPEENPFRPWGVLQRIGLVYGACAILFLRFQPRTLAIFAAAILLVYWPITLLPSLDHLPNDLWVRGHNFAASIDRLMLGAGHHLYVKGAEGYDPEGLLSTLPAMAHGLIGVLAGHYLVRQRSTHVSLQLAAFAASMLLLGLAWHFVFPIIKDLWSSSFVLVTAGLSILALAAFHRWVDHRPEISGPAAVVLAVPLAFGVNAIAAYVLHEVVAPMLGWPLMHTALERAQAVLGSPAGALVPPLILLVFVWVCMRYLQRHRWIVRI